MYVGFVWLFVSISYQYPSGEWSIVVLRTYIIKARVHKRLCSQVLLTTVHSIVNTIEVTCVFI